MLQVNWTLEVAPLLLQRIEKARDSLESTSLTPEQTAALRGEILAYRLMLKLPEEIAKSAARKGR